MKTRKYTKKAPQIDLQTHSCAWDGCMEQGIYPAPKSPKELNIRRHFCLEHVRRYNKSWNYFEGFSEEENQNFQEESITGHRPTWRMGVHGRTRHVREEDVLKALFETFSDRRYKPTEEKSHSVRIPEAELEALLVLELDSRTTRDAIKKRYKEMAKRYHPDVGGKETEDRFKAVVQAYHVLRTSEWFV
jgi:curved DNA-binding protein CbpA